MQKLLLLLFALLTLSPAFSQKELWSTIQFLPHDHPDYNAQWGGIVSVNLDGTDPQLVHAFDFVNGKSPNGKLLLGSSGKIYGTTFGGGITVPDSNQAEGMGVLFEYDPVLGTYTVLSFFGSASLQTSVNPGAGLLEHANFLIGTTTGYGSVYKRNLSAGTTAFAAQVPNFTSQLLTFNNELAGELTKASNGMVYGVTKNFSACPQGAPFLGSIARFNPGTNALALVHPLNCSPGLEGWAPTGGMVEALPGKLFGTTRLGGFDNGGTEYGSGILYEFNIGTNAFTKKIDFDAGTTGMNPGPLTLANNGKLYGLVQRQYDPLTIGNGTVLSSIFEYDPTTGLLLNVHNFVWPEIPGPVQGTLLNASDGKLYGKHAGGIFSYNPVDGAISVISTMPVSGDLIEICRKPSFNPAVAGAYSICAGSPFSLDLENDNATAFVWRRNGEVMPFQVTGVLDFDSISVSDTGSYTCEMTNECGITTTSAISITVNPAGPATVTSSIPSDGDLMMICPGTAVTLFGNDFGGSWSTGETTPTILVTQAGTYYIVNSNSCGQTYSNMVTVALYDALPQISISYDPSLVLCHGATITLSGNIDGGVWQDGSTGPTFTTMIDTETAHFVSFTGPCGTVTSNIIQFSPEQIFDMGIVPQVTTDGITALCTNNEVTLTSNRPGDDTATWTWYMTQPFFNYISNENTITLSDPGTYILRRESYCFGIVDSDPVVVTLNDVPPPTPVITIDGETPGNMAMLCEGSTLTLQSSGDFNLWSTGETTASIVVSEFGDYSVTDTNGCGTSEPAIIFVVPAPVLNDDVVKVGNILVASEPDASYQWFECDTAGPANPIAGATGQSFTASAAGLYAVWVTNAAGCTVESECISITDQDLRLNRSQTTQIVLYPNPAASAFNVRTDSDIDEITVINLFGQIVQTAIAPQNIDVSALPSGFYIVRVTSGTDVWLANLVKE